MQKKAHVSVSAKKKGSGGGKAKGKKLRHMILRPIANGIMSEMHHEPEGDEMMPEKPEETFHPNMQHLVDHIQGNASAFGGSESPEEEAAEEKEQAGGRTPDASSN